MRKNYSSIVLAGDFCPCGNELTQALTENRRNPHSAIREVFGDDAAFVANLECSFTDATRGRPYKWANLKASPSLHWTLDDLAIAILGNNHIADFGAQGVRDTRALLLRKGIDSVGYGVDMEHALQPTYLKIQDQTLGVVSLCCPTTNGENTATHLTAGVAPLGMQTLKQAVEQARPTCDALLVYLHWGCERVHDPAPDQLRLARHAIDCGADAVVGCHSHTIQGYENYRGRWIFYGLGNYLFGRGTRQRVSEDGQITMVPSILEAPNRESLVVQFSIVTDNDAGRLSLEHIQPLRFSDDWMPVPISISELVVDLDKCNRDIRRYIRRSAGALRDRSEPNFRTQLRNGILAYWYMKGSIATSRVDNVRAALRGRAKRMRSTFRSFGEKVFLKGARTLEVTAIGLKQARFGQFRVGRGVIDLLLVPKDIARSRSSYGYGVGRPLRLLRPQTFNEKLQRAKLFKRKARHSMMADKIAVRNYVQERVGEGVLSKIYWTGLDVKDAQRSQLPKKFVLKPNHCSGAVFLVEDVSTMDWSAARDFGRRWLDVDYSELYGEWQYRWIDRKLFIEEYLEGPRGGVAFDYKFYCFHGKVELLHVDVERFGNRARAFFDRDFSKRLPITRGTPQYEGELSEPACFRQMLEIAECLAAGEPFVRVDLYDVGRPVFGELTLYPHAGHGNYDPPEWDAHLGALWR